MKKERQKTENEKLFEFAKELRDAFSDINVYEERLANLEDLAKNSKLCISIRSLKYEGSQIDMIVDKEYILLLKEQTQKQLEQTNQKINELKKHITL